MAVSKNKKIKKIIAQEGVFSFLKKAIKFAISKIILINRVYIYKLDVEKNLPKSTTDINVSIRIAKPKDIIDMDNEFYGWDNKGKNYCLNRLKKGDYCLVGINEGKIISYIWGMKNELEISTAITINLPKDTAYSYNGFVIEEFRGHHVHASMISALYTLFKKDGKKFVLSGVNSGNLPALKTKNNKKGKYEIIAYLWHFIVFGKDITFINNKNLKKIQLEIE